MYVRRHSLSTDRNRSEFRLTLELELNAAELDAFRESLAHQFGVDDFMAAEPAQPSQRTRELPPAPKIYDAEFVDD